ncbi:MAG: XdhC/CoxI family protein [Candidatus Krumholzibacteriia bacterium]
MAERSWQTGSESGLYQELAELVRCGLDAVVVTVIGAEGSTPRSLGAKLLVHPDGRITGSVGGGSVEEIARQEAAAARADGRCRRVVRDLTGDRGACGGRVELFVEPVLSGHPFWIVGAGHVGLALARAAGELALRPVVIDDRTDYLGDPALAALPGVTTAAAGPEDLAAAGLAPTSRTAVLIASRDHELDAAYLAAIVSAERAAGCEAAWLGIVGSARKAARMLASVRAAHPDDPALAERLRRVRVPVGVEIGAETPAEIAVAILAELLAELRGAAFLRDGAGEPVGLPLRRRRDAATPGAAAAGGAAPDTSS